MDRVYICVCGLRGGETERQIRTEETRKGGPEREEEEEEEALYIDNNGNRQYEHTHTI